MDSIQKIICTIFFFPFPFSKNNSNNNKSQYKKKKKKKKKKKQKNIPRRNFIGFPFILWNSGGQKRRKNLVKINWKY